MEMKVSGVFLVAALAGFCFRVKVPNIQNGIAVFLFRVPVYLLPGKESGGQAIHTTSHGLGKFTSLVYTWEARGSIWSGYAHQASARNYQTRDKGGTTLCILFRH
ncbi:hypothetical protein ACFVS2_06070 [Brevibacillus sp. NPDC058079]|uniref:hypothetical protein n=1 Tax=Brevibacillus sp. NPDC058079 TaxID=3346330 RepID=UPI0036E841C1